jgi:DNA-binding response OmpR family regulator
MRFALIFRNKREGKGKVVLKKVLIVESDNSIRSCLRDLFGRQNIINHAVENGMEALHAIREDSYDLCLLDVNLKEIESYHVLKEIKNRSSARIIMMTGQYDIDILQQTWNFADSFLLKPFNPAELISAIHMFFYDFSEEDLGRTEKHSLMDV